MIELGVDMFECIENLSMLLLKCSSPLLVVSLYLANRIELDLCQLIVL